MWWEGRRDRQIIKGSECQVKMFRPFSECYGCLERFLDKTMTRLIYMLTRAKCRDWTWSKHLFVPGIMSAPHFLSPLLLNHHFGN